MKKGILFDADVEGVEYIWEPTPNGGDFTVIVYKDKYLRRCKKEDSVGTTTLEYKYDGTLVNVDFGDDIPLGASEHKEGQLLYAKDYAKENNLIIKDYAYDNVGNLFVRYNNPNGLEDVIVRVGYLFGIGEITDFTERNRAMKIIKNRR